MLLFDIDGTLVDAGGLGMSVMHEAAGRLFGGRLSYEGIDAAGRVDSDLFREAARRSGYTPAANDHDRLREAYVEALAIQLVAQREKVRALAGTLELIEQLVERVERDDERAAVLGCLTGNYAGAAHAKLHATGFDPAVFTVTAFGDEADTRPGLTELALQRYELAHGQPADPLRVIVIGDTPHDIDCAHAHGCRALGVATGGFSVEQLAAAGADWVVADLCDASVVMNLP